MPRTMRQVDERAAGNEDRDYEVESILRSQLRDGRQWYYIKWKGFDDSWNTWEPEDLMNCPDKVNEYNKRKLEEKPKVQQPSSKAAIAKPVISVKADDDVEAVEFAIVEQTQEPAVLFKINDQYELLPYKVAKGQEKYRIPIIDYFEKHLVFGDETSVGDVIVDL